MRATITCHACTRRSDRTLIKPWIKLSTDQESLGPRLSPVLHVAKEHTQHLDGLVFVPLNAILPPPLVIGHLVGHTTL